jgi:hypothetical protein
MPARGSRARGATKGPRTPRRAFSHGIRPQSTGKRGRPRDPESDGNPCKASRLKQPHTTENRGVPGSSSGHHGRGPANQALFVVIGQGPATVRAAPRRAPARPHPRCCSRCRSPSGTHELLHRPANHPRLQAADGVLSFAIRDAPRGKTLAKPRKVETFCGGPGRILNH